ncbi:MAG: NERD domain-containing protein [Syntrophomonadaceae bacterium]|nr:NERD domain-containing protein [Syntrophomonadaceae bacterium]
MSRMIPPFYDERITSDGEKKFFHALQRLDADYTVLHSLGVAYHQEKIFGEIDFVILSKRGILCLEVKGGHVSRREGLWCFTGRYGVETQKSVGPFMQVFSNMQTLRKHIGKQFGVGDPVARCQYACGVVFPDMPFTQKGPDIIQEVVFDTRRSLDEIEKYFEEVFEYWKRELERKHGFSGGTLSGVNINRAESYLRGDFGFIPSLGYIVERTEEKLLALTREQMERLSMARDNRCILLRGGAGTGKTLLSFEQARRKALSGKRVLFLCFNRNLCLNLRSVAKKTEPHMGNLIIDTFHGFILEALESRGYQLSLHMAKEKYYYETVLPENFMKMCLDAPLANQYDTLVVDEGQDLLRYEYIMCMDIMIRGGFQGGNWHFCYDPNQNLYNPYMEEGLALIQGYQPALLTLDTNCRNTRPIGIYNTLLTGMKPERFFRVDGENVLREPYSDFSDERIRLLRAVKRLIGQGIRPGTILLLSRFRYENSCLKGENVFRDICSFQDITNLKPELLLDNSIKFSTVQSFKGLEATVVCVLDVEGFKDNEDRLINYTAISRATSLLYIFYNRRLEVEMEDMIADSAGLLELIEE